MAAAMRRAEVRGCTCFGRGVTASHSSWLTHASVMHVLLHARGERGRTAMPQHGEPARSSPQV